MAVVQGIREKVHLPIYDAVFVEPGKQLRDVDELDNSGTLKFFVNVQKKSKLETNLQSASLLPHYNTFEARAMRVVISDLPAEFSADVDVDLIGANSANPETEEEVKTDLKRAMELLVEARDTEEGETEVTVDNATREESEETANVTDVTLTVADLEDGIESLEKQAPPEEQIRPSNGAGNLISKIIFNTVTTLYVGEKIMIQMPTWFFPGGAGAYSEGAKFISHGEPSPMATFRFAEPIYIDKQQNFRVEIEVPDKDVLAEIQKIYGPLSVWVVLDGYMVRDVQ